MVPIDYSFLALVRRVLAPDAHLSDTDNALAQAFAAVSDELIGLQANGIADTIKLIFGQHHDGDGVPARFADYLARAQLPVALVRGRLGLPQLRLLTALYAALWQSNAFKANGDFDLDGLIACVSHSLNVSNDWTISRLQSDVGQCHFDAINVACSFKGARFNGSPNMPQRLGPPLFKAVVFRNSILDDAVFSLVVAAGLTLDASPCRKATWRTIPMGRRQNRVCAWSAI